MSEAIRLEEAMSFRVAGAPWFKRDAPNMGERHFENRMGWHMIA